MLSLNNNTLFITLALFSALYFCESFANSWSGKGGPRGGHAGGGPMAFLRNVTAEARQQFFTITMNSNVTKAEQLSELQQWAANQTAEVQAAFANFTQTMQQNVQQFLDRLGANLTGEALTVFNQVRAIAQNQGLSARQECEQIQSLLAAQNSTVRRQIHIPQFLCERMGGGAGGPGQFGGGGPHGGPHGGGMRPQGGPPTHFGGGNGGMGAPMGSPHAAGAGFQNPAVWGHGNGTMGMDSHSAESPEVQPNA